MRSFFFTGLGIGFLLIGAGLYALTWRKPKAGPAQPSKAQLREQAELAEETRKMRIAAAILACVGAVMVVLSFT